MPDCRSDRPQQTNEADRAYNQGYDAAVAHAIATIERLPKEKGWTSARIIGVVGTLAAAVRNLSPQVADHG